MYTIYADSDFQKRHDTAFLSYTAGIPSKFAYGIPKLNGGSFKGMTCINEYPVIDDRG